jgi:putative endonuclease
MAKRFWVYILMSRSGTLYIGMTSDLTARIQTHRDGVEGSFVSRYQVFKLVYFEEQADAYSAIGREKQLKKWRRSKKLALLSESNPEFLDLRPF